MKHIYLFNEGSRAAVYGIGTYIRQMIAILSNLPDVRLNVVLLNSDKPEFEIEEKETYRVFHFMRVSLSSEKLDVYVRNAWYVLSAYMEEIREEDSLFFHFNYAQELPLLCLAKNYYPKCKTLFTIHYQTWCFDLDGNTTLFKRIMQERANGEVEERYKKIIENMEKELAVYSEVDSVISLSRYTYDLLIHTYGVDAEKIVCVYNGLQDEGVLEDETVRIQLKKELLFDESDKLILFVGRLDAIKGVVTLMEAFRLVLDVVPHARLLMVGEGNYSACLEKAKNVWNRITFTGRLTKEELYRFYRIADVGVMPSKHEQCSYVAIEMMMFGIPLVSSTSTGLGEMGNGLYKLEAEEKEDKVYLSAETLAQLIIEALQNPELGKRFRSMYEQAYTLERMKENMLSIYDLK